MRHAVRSVALPRAAEATFRVSALTEHTSSSTRTRPKIVYNKSVVLCSC